MQSLQFLIPGKVLGILFIGRGLDAVLPFTCYSYWFSCYFDQKGKLMKALNKRLFQMVSPVSFCVSQAKYQHCTVLGKTRAGLFKTVLALSWH
jgi:hypothetical protein